MTRDKFIERWTGIGGNVEDQIARDKMRDDLNEVISMAMREIFTSGIDDETLKKYESLNIVRSGINKNTLK